MVGFKNEREALLAGAVLGTLRTLVGESPFTYQGMRQADPVVDNEGNYGNRIIVTAADGAVFVVSVKQIKKGESDEP